MNPKPRTQNPKPRTQNPELRTQNLSLFHMNRFLSCPDLEVQDILQGRQRTGGKGTEGTGRIVSPVEIQDHLVTFNLRGIHESSCTIGFNAIACIPDDQEISLTGCKGKQGMC